MSLRFMHVVARLSAWFLSLLNRIPVIGKQRLFADPFPSGKTAGLFSVWGR